MAQSIERPELHAAADARSQDREVTSERGLATGRGVTIERYFTRAGVDPMAEVEWDLRSALISGEDGRVVFEQRDVEVPRGWSQTATNVVVSKYFRGPLGSPRRETSVRQLIARVVDTVTAWGERQYYFAADADRETFKAELTYLAAASESRFQQPGLFQRRYRVQTAMLSLLHPQS